MIFLYLLIFVMPLTRHRIWAFYLGDMTVIKYLGFLCLPPAILRLAAGRSAPQFFRTWQARWFVFLAALATFSYLTLGPPVSWIFNHGATYASFLLLFFITQAMVDTLPRLRWVLLTAIGAEALASLYILREWQTYHTVYVDFRPGFIAGDPNYYTASALVCLPLAFYLMQERRASLERFYCLGCVTVTVLGITLAASRGGFIGLAAAFLFVVLRSGRVLRNLAFAAALIIPLSVLSPASPLQRLLHPDASDQRSTDTRKAVWMGGLRMFAAHPLLGVGLDNFPRKIANYVPASEIPEGETVYRVAHNSYLEIAAEMGLPGLVALLAMIASSFLSLERVRKKALRSGAQLVSQASLGLQGGLVGFSVATFFVTAHYEKMFWMMVFITMCLPKLARQESNTMEARATSLAGQQSLVRNLTATIGDTIGNPNQPVAGFQRRTREPRKATEAAGTTPIGHW